MLKPGGRFAVTAWDQPARCDFFRTLFEPLHRFLGEAKNLSELAPFRLSASGALERTLRAAGFTDVHVERREVEFAFNSLSMHWTVASDLATPVRAAAATLRKPELTRLQAALAEATLPYMSGTRILLTNTALCASGSR